MLRSAAPVGACVPHHPVKRKDILRQIEAEGYDVHGTPASVDECRDDSLHFTSWHLVADIRDRAAHLGRGSPFHSLDIIV